MRKSCLIATPLKRHGGSNFFIRLNLNLKVRFFTKIQYQIKNPDH